jgi:hypothetical protein
MKFSLAALARLHLAPSYFRYFRYFRWLKLKCEPE